MVERFRKDLQEKMYGWKDLTPKEDFQDIINAEKGHLYYADAGNYLEMYVEDFNIVIISGHSIHTRFLIEVQEVLDKYRKEVM